MCVFADMECVRVRIGDFRQTERERERERDRQMGKRGTHHYFVSVEPPIDDPVSSIKACGSNLSSVVRHCKWMEEKRKRRNELRCGCGEMDLCVVVFVGGMRWMRRRPSQFVFICLLDMCLEGVASGVCVCVCV
jgi:hypothetical protein